MRYEVASAKSGTILGGTSADSPEQAVAKVMEACHDDDVCKGKTHTFHVREVGEWGSVDWTCKPKL